MTPLEHFQAARDHVVREGFEEEIVWARRVRFAACEEPQFLAETAFVILNSGMRARVIDGVWPHLKTCFWQFASHAEILFTREACLEQARKFFKHEGKLQGIVRACELVRDHSGWAGYKVYLQTDTLARLREIPFVGPITVYHLARNLGLDFAKPDRHLQQLAARFGEPDVQRFCEALAQTTGERVGVIDVILWRDAVLRAEGNPALEPERIVS